MAEAVRMTYGSPYGQSPRDIGKDIGNIYGPDTQFIRLNVQGMRKVTVRLYNTNLGLSCYAGIALLEGDAGKDRDTQPGTECTLGPYYPSGPGGGGDTVSSSTEVLLEADLAGQRYVDVWVHVPQFVLWDEDDGFIFAFVED